MSIHTQGTIGGRKTPPDKDNINHTERRIVGKLFLQTHEHTDNADRESVGETVACQACRKI